MRDYQDEQLGVNSVHRGVTWSYMELHSFSGQDAEIGMKLFAPKYGALEHSEKSDPAQQQLRCFFFGGGMC